MTGTGKEKVDRRFPKGYNLTDISWQADLSPRTVAKIIKGFEGVNLKTLERFFNNLLLDLEAIDYEEFIPNNYQSISVDKSKREIKDKTGKPTFKTGYILTGTGKEKVDRRFPKGYNLTDISRQADLSPRTVAKVIDGVEGVSLKTLEKFSSNLLLDLEAIDYKKFQSD